MNVARRAKSHVSLQVEGLLSESIRRRGTDHTLPLRGVHDAINAVLAGSIRRTVIYLLAATCFIARATLSRLPCTSGWFPVALLIRTWPKSKRLVSAGLPGCSWWPNLPLPFLSEGLSIRLRSRLMTTPPDPCGSKAQPVRFLSGHSFLGATVFPVAFRANVKELTPNRSANPGSRTPKHHVLSVIGMPVPVRFAGGSGGIRTHLAEGNSFTGCTGSPTPY